MSPGPVLIVILIIAAVIALIVLVQLQEKKRREALARIAERLGLVFEPEKNHDFARQLDFLDRMRSGSNRYLFNLIAGNSEGELVKVFDFHYETRSTNSKGQTQTQHHYLSFFALSLPKAFPELTISREGLFSKIAQAFGYDDIDFESHEFSKRYCVRSKDKKFAYDVCNARMIEFLLANRDLQVEIDQTILTIVFEGKLNPVRVEPDLLRLRQMRSLLPDYLFQEV